MPLSQLLEVMSNSNEDGLPSAETGTTLFKVTEAAQEVVASPDFQSLFEQFQQACEEEEENGEVGEDLPPEDDEGNIEYKFNMCGINMAKVDKRTTQMAYRLFVSSHHHF